VGHHDRNDLQDQLYTASVEDEKALASQSTESRWNAIDARQVAEETISHFLYPAQRSAPLLAFLFVGRVGIPHELSISLRLIVQEIILVIEIFTVYYLSPNGLLSDFRPAGEIRWAV
jgi:hypothetical protein